MEYKFYSREILVNSIENEKNKIDYVDCFFDGDFQDTFVKVFEDGEYTIDINDEKSIVSGVLELNEISGSYRAEPMMKIVYKDGSSYTKACFIVKKQIDVTNELIQLTQKLKNDGVLKLETKAKATVLDELSSVIEKISRIK